MNKSASLWSNIRSIQNFPKKGVCFYDLTALFTHNLTELVDALVASIPADELSAVDSFVAVESRGAVLASLLAQRTGKGLLFVHKVGKLPAPVVGVGSSLEYGVNRLEISALISPQKVIIVDDILATGGTLKAVKQLMDKCKHTVLGASVFLDLPNSHQDLGLNLWSVLEETSKPVADAA